MKTGNIEQFYRNWWISSILSINNIIQVGSVSRSNQHQTENSRDGKWPNRPRSSRCREKGRWGRRSIDLPFQLALFLQYFSNLAFMLLVIPTSIVFALPAFKRIQFWTTVIWWKTILEVVYKEPEIFKVTS